MKKRRRENSNEWISKWEEEGRRRRKINMKALREREEGSMMKENIEKGKRRKDV